MKETKRQTIFDITREYADLYDALWENDGELTDEIEAALERLDENDLPKKLEALVSVMKDAEGEAEKAWNHAKTLSERKARYENTAARIRGWIIHALRVSDHDLVKTPNRLFEIKLRKGLVKVSVLDRHRAIPKSLRAAPPPKPPPRLNKAKAAERMKPKIGDADYAEDVRSNLKAWREPGLIIK